MRITLPFLQCSGTLLIYSLSYTSQRTPRTGSSRDDGSTRRLRTRYQSKPRTGPRTLNGWRNWNLKWKRHTITDGAGPRRDKRTETGNYPLSKKRPLDTRFRCTIDDLCTPMTRELYTLYSYFICYLKFLSHTFCIFSII